ncbi:dienelactone hydrolase family protein [Gordonia sputi]|uniref:dienelactone hydrolase family protein n=1 Tax=Gordonia sputi TaxID=36823 RepID=UPI00367D0E3B
MARKKRVSTKSPDKLSKQLARRGPHKVLRGDLGIVGMPGHVFTPADAGRYPAIAFGHGWLTGANRYRSLLYHFASWGIVVAAPDDQKRVMASDIGLAADLRAAASIVSNYSLGTGEITVDRDRIGFVGHGFGASAAVIAAGDQQLLGQEAPDARGVVALFPAPTTPALPQAAKTATAPCLLLTGAGDLDNVDANALALARDYAGDVSLRTIPKATRAGIVERPSVKSLLGFAAVDRKSHSTVRAMSTGFLLYTLTGDPQYAAFADAEAQIGKTTVVELDEVPEQRLDSVSRLLGAKSGGGARQLLAKSPVR